MNKVHKIQIYTITIMVLITISVIGFLKLATSYGDMQVDSQNEYVPKSARAYDSEDEAILLYTDIETKEITLQNVSTGKRYTLGYDGATELLDKYNQAFTLAQFESGEIVRVRFSKGEKHLAYMKQSDTGFGIKGLTKYEIDSKAGTMAAGDMVYQLSSHLTVMSNGKEIKISDINDVDEIGIWGYQNQIYSINVEKGHGYLRLKNETYFVGGWLEIGQALIRKIEEDMLVVVPEGTYVASITQKSTNATQEITFRRDEELEWDLSNVEIVLPQNGTIIFTITPADAKVVIDGEIKDIANPVELQYGIHQITITAKGYETLAKYIKVKAPSANISVDLEKSSDYVQEEREKNEKSESESNKEEKETTEKTTQEDDKINSNNVSNTFKICIDAPKAVEVYFDGNYIGIVPIQFPKQSGSHVITLRKDGYQTRSYTVEIDNEQKDVNYSFSELIQQ